MLMMLEVRKWRIGKDGLGHPEADYEARLLNVERIVDVRAHEGGVILQYEGCGGEKQSFEARKTMPEVLKACGGTVV